MKNLMMLGCTALVAFSLVSCEAGKPAPKQNNNRKGTSRSVVSQVEQVNEMTEVAPQVAAE